MEIILIGGGIWLVTELSKYLTKRFNVNISSKYVVVGLSLIAGLVYYYFQTYSPELREQAITFAGGAFAVSQAIWMVLEKLVNTSSETTTNTTTETTTNTVTETPKL